MQVGAFGLGKERTFEIFKTLVTDFPDIQMVAISGKNQKMNNLFNEFVATNHAKDRIKVLEFTKQVPELMSISDLVITKPGGLAVTEALEMKTPMILIPGNGGQENHNAKFITKNHFGIRTYNSYQLGKTIKKLVENKEIIKNMYNNLKDYEENKSIEKLFKVIEKLEIK